MVYVCTCESCKVVRHPSVGGVGKGHGPAWIEPMLAIGQTLQNVLQRRVQVGLYDSMKLEMRQSDWEPTFQEIQKWDIGPNGLSPGELALYGWLHDSRRKEWELQRPERDELARQREEEERKRDKEIKEMIIAHLGREMESEEERQRTIPQQFRNKYRVMSLAEELAMEREMGEELQKLLDKERKYEMETQKDETQRLGNANTSESRGEERHRYGQQEVPRRKRQERDEPKNMLGLPPEINPRKDQMVLKYDKPLPPLPPSGPGRSAKNSSRPRRAS